MVQEQDGRADQMEVQRVRFAAGQLVDDLGDATRQHDLGIQEPDHRRFVGV